MNELKIIGKQNIDEIDFIGIEGAFGEKSKCILAKDIANIHGKKLKHINEAINNNIGRFKNGVDIIDLIVVDHIDHNFKHMGFSNMQVSKAKNIYLLSERGYSKLLKILDDDFAWEKYDSLVDTYFTMRKIINSDDRLKADLLLEIYKGGQDGILASKQLVELEVKPLVDKIENDKPMVEFAETIAESSDTIDMGTLAKLIKDEGIYFGRNKLFEWLRSNKYLRSNNQPYQRYIDMKIFEIKEYVIKTPYGDKNNIQTLVTGKGQVYIVQKLKEEFSQDKS